MRKYFIKVIQLVILMMIMQPLCYSQSTITLFGKVVEEGSGEVLIGANVILVGMSIGASTDRNGIYSIPRVRPGEYQVRVSYIGFNSETKVINVVAGDDVELNFELTWQGVTSDIVTVTAQARGQMSAINQQRMSNRITNIVSSDRIQELPDVNAAESIGRLPGVAILRSGGEANKIAIRGMSPKFSTVTVNGVRMPSVDTQERDIDLSLVSSNMLDGIEVTKALTADQDADAIGGTVDLRLRTAPERLLADFQVLGGYTRLQNYYGNYKFSGNLGNRFLDNKFGVIVGFNTDRYDRSADQFSGDYELIPNPQAAGALTPNVTNLTLRENALTRSRLGGNTLLDYRLSNGKIVFSSFYNFLKNETNQRVNSFEINSNRHRYSHLLSSGDASVFTASLTVEQEFNWISYDAGAAKTESLNKHPNDYYWDFMEESAFDGTRLDEMRFASPENIPPVFRNNIDNTYFENLNYRTSKTNESEVSGFGNLKVPFQFSKNIEGYIKTGFRVRELTRRHDVEQIGAGLYYGGGQELRDIIASGLPGLGLNTGMNRFPLTFFQSDYNRNNFLNSKYPIGYTLDVNSLMEVTNLLMPYFNYSVQGSLGEDYNGTESYKAAYVMSEINISRYVTLIPGVRFEKEDSEYHGKFLIGSEDRPVAVGGGIPPNVTFRDTTATRGASFVLPMIHMQIKPTDGINLRLAYTQTLSRPGFRQYAPITYISTFRDWVNAPNTNLKTAKSVNYDASLSFFQKQLGFLTVSAFYKEIEDMIWFVSFPLLPGQTILPEFVLPDISGVPRVNTHLNNIYPAKVRGLEFDWQTNFWYLPSFLKGLVLNVNYTILDSETKYPQFRRERIPITPRPIRPPFFEDVLVDTTRVGRIPDQPSSIMNITLGYDYKGFSIRASYLYQSDILRSLATNPENDRFTEDYYRIDLSIRQRINSNIQIFTNLNNLNNRADRNYQSSIGNYPTFIEYYGFTMDVGIRYTR